MSRNLKYVPIFRGRQEEVKVLVTHDFGPGIFPCLEIIKEVDRLPPKPRKTKKPDAKPIEPKEPKKFEEVYLPLLEKVNAKRVFVDIPVHLTPKRSMKPETLKFLQVVAGSREKRTEYINKLVDLKDKIIPVISTFSQRTGEPRSIELQERELRQTYPVLCFRTFAKTFVNDIEQIKKVSRPTDYLIMDWEDSSLDIEDEEQIDIIEEIKKCKCFKIIHRNAVPGNLTNIGLEHGKVVKVIDNSLIEIFQKYNGTSFSDYAGIKKDDISKGGGISPGFIYYDAVRNRFYGFKGTVDKPITFKTIIVPDVIASRATLRMNTAPLPFLSSVNFGWQMLNDINIGIEPGQSAAKFKRIGMEHYIHCLKTRIANGDF